MTDPRLVRMDADLRSKLIASLDPELADEVSDAYSEGITEKEGLPLAEARKVQMGSYCEGALKLRAAFTQEDSDA